MEANIVVKADDLTPDFADGLRKVFSKDAVLHIKVEYELPATGSDSGSASPAPQRRGRPKATAAPTGKKRGRKPKAEKLNADGSIPKKRGRKPKEVVTEEV